MQKSKSINSFAPTTEHTEHLRGTRTQPQRRSSLDTFVIPGRTRLPSSKSSQDSTDIQIAQALLNHNPHQHSRKPVCEMAAREAQSRKVLAREHSSTPMTENPAYKWNKGPDMNTILPPLRGSGPELLVVPPHRRAQTEMFQGKPQVFVTTATATDTEPGYGESYDGVFDSNEAGNVSRMTSMTWSTVSHRVISDSSGSSRASRASDFKQEYNELAEKHGLPILTGDYDEEDSNSSQTKTTQKSHHHGWLARKLFRRTSSSYTLKAKTTYKPIPKKKSLGGIRLLSDDAPTNILTGKNLEEISRLGGLGTFVLPSDFAADSLSLPTCLAATATHLLEYGCNAPGIFRVSGTNTTINELYKYFDHQFSDAGSPSKVEATVGTGQLPSNMEYALPDIASLFKKIIISLPGGLLGSLELFEVLRNIVLVWKPNPQLSAANPNRLRAKLIALAILSVTSVYRAYLIQAVLGLVAYFGFEADKAQAAEKAATEGQPKNDQSGSELMGYQSLGKVLGPLLLGDLTGGIDVDGGVDALDSASISRLSAELRQEDAKKSKKQKRNSVPNKLEKDANLTAHVDRANLAAEVMHQLLLNWREVVKQLRELNGLSSFLQPSKSMNQIKNTPPRVVNRYSTNTSEDNLQLLDILRGRPLPEGFDQRGFRGPVKMKHKARVTSRSPMSRGAIKTSGHSHEGHSYLPGASDIQAGNIPTASKAVDSGAQGIGSTTDPESSHDASYLDNRERTNSEIGMDQMAMGTILRSRQGSSISSQQKPLPHHPSPTETPRKPSRTQSASDAPDTVVRVPLINSQRKPSVRLVHQSSTDKPLPPIGDAQRAEYRSASLVDSSPPTALEDKESLELHEKIISARKSRRSHTSMDSSPFATRPATPRTLFPSRSSVHWTPPELPSGPLPETETLYPPRQSSLPSEQGPTVRPINSLPTFESMAAYKAWCAMHSSSPALPPTSRKTSEVLSVTEQERDRAKRNSSGSVKFLAQKFSEASRVTRIDEQARQAARNGNMPMIHAYVNPIAPPLSPLYDPFLSASNLSLNRSSSPEKHSLIPKPISDMGRGRSVERSHSPTKIPNSPKRTELPNTTEKIGKRLPISYPILDQDAKIVRSNFRGDSSIYSDAQTTITAQDRSRGISPAPARRIESTGIDSSHRSTSQESNVSLSRPFSFEPVDRLHADTEGPDNWRDLQELVIDRPIPASRFNGLATEQGNQAPSSPSHIETYLNASDAPKTLERHGSNNATLYQVIRHLERRLERKEEEERATRRSLDAIREARDARDGNLNKSSARNSWSKGTVSEEVKEANRELRKWKRRAEEAEKRLADFERLGPKFAGKKDINVDVLLERSENDHTNRNGIDVEVLVDRKGKKLERLAELYVDHGWGGDALNMSSGDPRLEKQ